MRGLGTVCAVRVSEDSLICVKISGVAGHAFVDKCRGRGAVLDGKVSKGHFCIRQITGQSGLPPQRSPQFRVETAVVQSFKKQPQEVSER